jgi:hemoglobin-like flavoprotein
VFAPNPLGAADVVFSSRSHARAKRGVSARHGSEKDQMVTAVQKSLVQASWQELAPLSPHVAELFYDRLFELDPSLEEMFPANLSLPGAQLMKVIGLIVRGLDDLDRVTPMVQESGRNLVDHGARPGHYVTVGKALLWTFEQSLAEEFNPRLKEAWADVFALVSSLMIEAASEVAAVSSTRESGTRDGSRRSQDAAPRGIRQVG